MALTLTASLLKVCRDVNLADTLRGTLGLGPLLPWVGGTTPHECLMIRRQQSIPPHTWWCVDLPEDNAGMVTREVIGVQLTH